jgi:hypothetical protein
LKPHRRLTQQSAASVAVDSSTAGKTLSFSNIFLSNAHATASSTRDQAGKFQSFTFAQFFCVLIHRNGFFGIML